MGSLDDEQRSDRKITYTRPVKILSGFRYGTLVSAHSSPAQNPDPASGTQLGEDTARADETPARTIEGSPDAPRPYSGFPLR
jgi:hypothetical protein